MGTGSADESSRTSSTPTTRCATASGIASVEVDLLPLGATTARRVSDARPDAVDALAGILEHGEAGAAEDPVASALGSVRDKEAMSALIE